MRVRLELDHFLFGHCRSGRKRNSQSERLHLAFALPLHRFAIYILHLAPHFALCTVHFAFEGSGGKIVLG